MKSGVHFEQSAQEATLLDYIHEVDHVAGRIERLERAIDDAVRTAPAPMRAVIDALQALRGIAKVSAVTIVAEVGELSRFARAPQLMGYSGMGAREDSSGERTRRGGITKTGNAHLRRIVIEAAWAYRHRPSVGGALRKRQATLSDEVKAIAWKAQHRLHTPLPQAARPGQVSTAGGDGGRPRTRRLHLGDRGRCGNRTDGPAVGRGVGQPGDEQERSNGGGRGAHGKENPRGLLCGRPPGRTRAA